MSFQYIWDSTFESLPDNNTYGYLIDDYFRQLYIAIRERMQVDHIWKVGATDGGHNRVSLALQATKPTAAAGYGYVYSKDVGAGAIELFYEDAAGNETELTSAGSNVIKQTDLTAALLAHLAVIYPIGCIYTSTVATNPATVFGFGTWVAFGAGEVLVGKATGGTFSTAGATGGAETCALSSTEMPSHAHTMGRVCGGNGVLQFSPGTGMTDISPNTGSTGGGSAHNNLQPYIVVYFWTRTA